MTETHTSEELLATLTAIAHPFRLRHGGKIQLGLRPGAERLLDFCLHGVGVEVAPDGRAARDNRAALPSDFHGTN